MKIKIWIWRIMLVVAWMFVCEETNSESFGEAAVCAVIIFLVSRLIYRMFVYQWIYGIKWSERNQEITDAID